MALTSAEKKEIVDSFANVAAQSISAVVAEYRGLTSLQMTALRAEARKNDVHLQVVKNTLSKRALEDTPFACLSEALKGPVFIAFSTNAPSDAARLIKNYKKANNDAPLEVTALSVSGKLLPASELNAVASLPTLDEARAKLLGVLQAPLEKLVRTVAEPHSKLVRTLAAVRDKLKEN